ncbi:MAG: hypothetical protein GX921_08390 [Bacteroidales bacterium]|nr:hypothetical protein [Bacteroidales bacterium]
MKKATLSMVCLFIVIAISSCGGSSKQLTDQEVLVVMYEAMNGPNWKDAQKENWLSDQPIGKWKGVETNEEGRVIKLVLKADSVTELVPADIGGLTELEELSIYINNNGITNDIPAEIGSLTKLKHLYLNLSLFIPYEERPLLPDITTLVNLKYLFVSGFRGTIPDNIRRLSKLQTLSLHGLEGEIPKSICELSELEELVLNTNKQPKGEVPESIGKPSKLKKLNIDYSTGFAGSIKRPDSKFPESIWDLSNLEYLFLRTVSNTGEPIPGEKVAKMKNLKGVTIIDCGITGTIPTELFTTGELRSLDIYRNTITGTIPTEIGNCSQLSSIKLHHNSLTGTIPVEIGNCTKLTLFLLNDNQLTGNIPNELAKCEKLIMFDLSNNQLSSNIPTALKTHPKFSNFKF